MGEGACRPVQENVRQSSLQSRRRLSFYLRHMTLGKLRYYAVRGYEGHNPVTVPVRRILQ
jgi:hypothetical protein